MSFTSGGFWLNHRRKSHLEASLAPPLKINIDDKLQKKEEPLVVANLFESEIENATEHGFHLVKDDIPRQVLPRKISIGANFVRSQIPTKMHWRLRFMDPTWPLCVH